MFIVVTDMENQASKPLLSRLTEAARNATTSAGVYLMKDEQENILYVGKAKNLKNRLVTYFQSGNQQVARIDLLVSRIHHFDLILTETEAEALILECSLIKKHKPKFNVRLKDDKAYPYIKIQWEDQFPRLEWTRRVQKDGARYFGPFPSALAAREVMECLNKTFRLRDCSNNTFRHRSRPCILFQMNKCTAPCVEKITQSEYRESVQSAAMVLEGKSDQLVKSLRKGMEDAANRQEYEEAAHHRDQLRNLEIVTATQVADEAGTERARDIVGLARKDSLAEAVVLLIRGGKMIAVRHYHLQNTDSSMLEAEILFDLLAQYYVLTDSQVERPREVLLPSAPQDPDLLERTLSVGIRVAETQIEEQLLNIARTNAEYALEQTIKRALAPHGAAALKEVQDKLHLPHPPHRIECYDISNIQGTDAVASRVVFIEGAPDKNLYRRYKIRTVGGAVEGGPNDFAMMKEVLARRFKNIAEPSDRLPDLVVVDGGKGQLAQAVAVMDELGIQGVNAVGLAKAKVEHNFRAKEVKASRERIFIPGRKNPVPLLSHTAAYKLLTHVRDEAHRFAISYHRLLRSAKIKPERFGPGTLPE